jgi:death-on-curing protein
MHTPEFLTIQEVLEIHANQIESYGGSPGIRDQGLLEAALAQPEATFGGDYLHHGLYEMAAAYLFHLVQNHPFIDGNKRVGTVAAVVFLSINGIELKPELDNADKDADTVLQKVVLAVASGKMQKPELAVFLRTSSIS